MQGKTKGFFEDTGLILVLVALIYGGYYVYDTYFITETTPINNDKKIVIMDNIKGPLDDITLESNSITKEALSSKQEVVSFLGEIQKLESEIMVKEEVKSNEKVESKEEIKQVVTLESFLSDVKYAITNSIVDDENISKTEYKELKIRITILKDGSYEQLRFVDGDKKLFEKNKENILKNFPLDISDNIRESFPRYLRMTIQ